MNVNSEFPASALPLTINVSPLTELNKVVKSTSNVVCAEFPVKLISLDDELYVPPLT